jgi:O-antigen/teichoic acid export membrane protein
VALGASGATTLAFNLVLAHVLSRAAYGDVARSLALALGVAQLTMAGLAPALARSVAGASPERRWSRAAAGLGPAAAASGVVALLYVPLAALGLAPWGRGVGVGVVVAAVYATYFGLKCVLFALDEVALYARWELTADAVFFALLAAFAVRAPHDASAVFALAYGLFVVGVARLVLRRGDRRAERVDLDRDFGRFTALATVATYASVARLPLVTAVAGAAAGSRDAAGVAAMVALVMPLFLVPQAAGMLTFATFARAPSSDHRAHLTQMVRTVAVCSVAIAVPLVLFAEPLVSLLLGSSYRGDSTAFVILVLGAVPQLVATPVANAISGEGAVGINAALASAALVVALVGTAVFAPRYGVVGAASALAASMTLLGIGTLLVGRFRFGWRVEGVPAT